MRPNPIQISSRCTMSNVLPPGMFGVNIIQLDHANAFEDRIANICDGRGKELDLSLPRAQVIAILHNANFCWDMEQAYGDSYIPAELTARLNVFTSTNPGGFEEWTNTLADPKIQPFLKAFSKCLGSAQRLEVSLVGARFTVNGNRAPRSRTTRATRPCKSLSTAALSLITTSSLQTNQQSPVTAPTPR